MTGNQTESEKIELINIITQNYEAILSSDPSDRFWSIRYWELHSLIYKFFETYVYTKESSFYLDFIEAFSNDYKGDEGSETQAPYSTFLNYLIKNKIESSKLLPVIKAIMVHAISNSKKSNFWFYKSGGSRIGEKTLRKIVDECDETNFSVVSENVNYNGQELSLFDSEAAMEHTASAEVPEAMIDIEDAEELEALLSDVDQKYVKEVTYKTNNNSVPQDGQKIKKPYLCAIVTRVIILLFMCKRRIPQDTMYYLLYKRRFLYRPMLDEYIETGEVCKQVDIAKQFNQTEKIISNEQKKFFESFSKNQKNRFLFLAGGK